MSTTMKKLFENKNCDEVEHVGLLFGTYDEKRDRGHRRYRPNMEDLETLSGYMPELRTYVGPILSGRAVLNTGRMVRSYQDDCTKFARLFAPCPQLKHVGVIVPIDRDGCVRPNGQVHQVVAQGIADAFQAAGRPLNRVSVISRKLFYGNGDEVPLACHFRVNAGTLSPWTNISPNERTVFRLLGLDLALTFEHLVEQ